MRSISRDFRKLMRGKFHLNTNVVHTSWLIISLLSVWLDLAELLFLIYDLCDMVKTRSQQKITFPSRKPKSLSKSDVKSDDTSSSNSKACCISTLSRVCYREKVKDVESFDERFQVESSSAKKMLNGDIFEEHAMFPVTPRRTRRALSYEDDAENDQSQAVPTRRSEPCNRSNELFKSSSRSKSQKMPSLKAAVNSPQKNDVSQRGSPLKCSSRLEHTGRSIFGRGNNAQFTNRIGKRRHSSTSDNETSSLANHLPNKRAVNEHRPLSKSLSSPSPEKQRELHNPSTSGMENVTPNRQLLCVGTRDGLLYKETKHVLHSSIPDSLLCRDTERKYIESFLKSHLVHKKPGSLYISGAPGTGKTACLTRILEQLQKNGLECQLQFINCMNLSKSHRIYSKITEELTGWDKLTNKEAQKFLEKKFTIKGSPIVLILDEIDQLESKNQDVLYTMFEWPSLPSSSLILIGIANALDLTDRVLPRLQLRTECKPKLLHFSPYSKDQIAKILTARLNEVKGSSIVDVSAVQFCARKIAAVSGDMRKALDICRRAVEIVECEVRRQQVLKPIEQASSPRKAVTKKVTIAHVSKVISEVYGSRIVSCSGGEQPTIPLQQKLLICTILLLQKESKLREIPVGQLHETYCNICKKRQVSQISQEDCLALCNLLETRGIISMKRAKETRMAKVSLKIDEKEVDHALQDKILLSSILQEGLCNI